MSVFSKAFVFLVFAVLGLSFWLTTGLLYWEFSENWRQPRFEGALWFDLMSHHSHVFLFFPLFGTIALFAFFLPATVFVDMYWRPALNPENDIPYCKLRFVIGFIVLVTASAAGSYALNLGEETALWQLKRDVLMADARLDGAQPSGGQTGDGLTGDFCAEPGQSGRCRRVTYATALANVWRVSQDRERLTDLRRRCRRDPLIEPKDTPEPRRFCFVTARYDRDAAKLSPMLLGDAACCAALARFEASVANRYAAGPENRSWLDRVQFVTLALKIFFLLVILAISILLALRHRRIMTQYRPLCHRVDRGVLIGTVAMLFLPFMNHAFMLSTELIYGPNDVLAGHAGTSFYRVPHALSIAFGVWCLFIMLFFIRREDKEAERMTKIISALISGIFVLNYETIINYAVRYVGPGLGNYTFAGLALAAVVMCIALVCLKTFWGNERPLETVEPRPSRDKTAAETS